MATTKQVRAAKRNARTAQSAAKRERTIVAGRSSMGTQGSIRALRRS